ncbi:hypothetical protein EMIT0P294_10470 [Pseudomonas sp. IT-P294]
MSCTPNVAVLVKCCRVACSAKGATNGQAIALPVADLLLQSKTYRIELSAFHYEVWLAVMSSSDDTEVWLWRNTHCC